MSDPLLLRNVDGGVATLTMNRPDQFNSLSGELLAELQHALDDMAADSSVRAVVLAGAGKAFCAGHDLKQMRANHDKEYMRRLFRQCGRLMTKITSIPQPVIARVHGIATAAGCQLVASCDLAVAVETARFAVSGINVGLFCSTPAVALSRNVGRKQAMEMLLTGEFIDAPEAQRRGLVNRVVKPDTLDEEIRKLTASICEKSAAAVRLGKQLFYRQLEMGIDAAYQMASETMACNMMFDDAGEGIDAFMAKRKPEWKNR
ncbi:MAG: enoyl-CoA hydratase [Gammaproteobacteria bacterium]|nr:enoyl-CoA hydratase [Gammaproteobacteria bacterium]MBU1414019.1 enoyl-CoA hydratase [Gammaproteobacteria bacterium]